MKNNKEIQINARIIKVKILNFNQNDISNLEYSNEQIVNLNFDTTIKFAYSKVKNELSILVSVASFVGNFEFCKIKVENTFEVTYSVLDFQNNEVNIPDFVIKSLVEASISNVRGILVEKFRGTVFQDDILPLITLSDFKESK